jgi:hypothetical protein
MIKKNKKKKKKRRGHAAQELVLKSSYHGKSGCPS